MNDKVTRPVLSVVDYDAWNRGYMPPSEHVLIDKLAYRGARVQLSTAIGLEHQIWIVVEGPPLTNKQRKNLRKMVNLWFEDEPEETTDARRMTDSERALMERATAEVDAEVEAVLQEIETGTPVGNEFPNGEPAVIGEET